MRRPYLQRTGTVRKLRISHSTLSGPPTCRSWRRGARRMTGEACARGAEKASRRRAGAIRTVAGEDGMKRPLPPGAYLYRSEAISFLARYTCARGSPALKPDPVHRRVSSSPSLFILHWIFYNPGRQLDPVVVILLNGKIRD